MFKFCFWIIKRNYFERKEANFTARLPSDRSNVSNSIKNLTNLQPK
jgi:hypothetical protein